jgi:hypothetical protein
MKHRTQNHLKLLSVFFGYTCLLVSGITLFSFTNPKSPHAEGKKIKPRIIVTADPELDDNNSLIRFLLYSSDFDVEGLIYASSQFHWKGDGKGTKFMVPGREYTRFGLKICPCESWRWAKDERFIHNAVEAYEKVYPNLKVHDADYPSPELLKSKIRYGNIEFDGDMSKDSPGSDLIKSLMLDDKPGPLFITAWGGQSTIARALKSIQDQYENTAAWPAIRKKISDKVVILPSGDQDDTYAKYIKPNWPDIDYRQFRGGPNYGYGAQLHAKPEDSVFLTPTWMKENITDRGPLGSIYRVWGDGKQMVKDDKFDYFGMAGYTNEELKKMGYIVWMPVQQKGSWLGEGDTFTYMDMLDNGLRAYEKGDYGGWGGKQISDAEMEKPIAKPADTTHAASDTSLNGMVSTLSNLTAQMNKRSKDFAYPDFFPEAERDFAARLKWSVTPKYAQANHEPKVRIDGAMNIAAKPGEKVPLKGIVIDPDGDKVAIKWWQFRVGTYGNEVAIMNPNAANAEMIVPADAVAGQTIHIILEATDNGSPSLTRYQRMIITVN